MEENTDIKIFDQSGERHEVSIWSNSLCSLFFLHMLINEYKH